VGGFIVRFRQVHLDFHTSEAIPGIGIHFSKKQFQQMLLKGHVDSITIFSKCHHGWAYHPSQVNEQHPHLTFDLLGSMIEAAQEIDVRTPVYISAGLDEKLARRHPEWLIRNQEDQTGWAKGFMVPGYHEFCFNTPYLDILVTQIEEVIENYDVDGIFLDIVGVRPCYCQNCIRTVRERSLTPRDQATMQQLWEETYAKYTRRTNEAARKLISDMPVFHNGGHIRKGRRDLAHMNSHLELESLPTGGWGYDHFPLSARYAQTLGMKYLGMTGKFHTTWGEFGGYKHPNALRYETALSLANGSRCSIGDQLHPKGLMDEATYNLIGSAYKEVEAKEAWCIDTTNIADVALLSVEAVLNDNDKSSSEVRAGDSDAGAVRMLLEGKLLFDVIDTEAEFRVYKVIILPDMITMNRSLTEKLLAYVNQGGKVLATGKSGLDQDNAFVLDLGVRWVEEDVYQPSFFRPSFQLPSLSNASFVMYAEGQKVELTNGDELGSRENSYFNRDVFTFCSHQHTPSTLTSAGPGMVEGAHGIYIAWNVFADYCQKGSLFLKEIVLYALQRLLPEITLQTTLSAQGVVTLQAQEEHSRWVQHSLYASPVKRGRDIEVIEDLLSVYDTEVRVRVSQSVKKVYMAPQLEDLTFTQVGNVVTYSVPIIHGHQMVVLQF
jgi:hypothetical protein